MAKKGILPPNIDDGGRVLGGMIKQRNLIETAVFLGFLFAISKIFLFAVPLLIKYAIMLVIGLPGALFCIIGIGDLSFTEWLQDRHSFKESRETYPFRIPSAKTEKKQNIFKKKRRKSSEQ